MLRTGPWSLELVMIATHLRHFCSTIKILADGTWKIFGKTSTNCACGQGTELRFEHHGRLKSKSISMEVEHPEAPIENQGTRKHDQ